MTLTLTIDNASAAMLTAEDVADALDTVAARVRAGRTEASIMDVNGNTVGRWSLDLPAPDDDHGFDA